MSSRTKRRPGAPGGKRDQNRKLRTKQLLDAALALFLKRGIESVTIDEIVEEAGLAKGSFYRYFEDKSAVVAALFVPMKARMAEAFAACEQELVAADDRESLNLAYVHLAERIAGALLEGPDVVRLYLQECRGPAEGARKAVRDLADRIDERAVHLTRVAHERGLLKPFDGRVSATAVVGATEKLAFAVLSGRDLGNPLGIPDALITLVLDGLRGRS